MSTSLPSQSNQPQSPDETSLRRPRTLFEDVSLTNDSKINTTISEKHLRTDGNALDPTIITPVPAHPYIRNQPYYLQTCKSCAPITSNQIFDLESACLQPICTTSKPYQQQPTHNMFANMPKFDLSDHALAPVSGSNDIVMLPASNSVHSQPTLHTNMQPNSLPPISRVHGTYLFYSCSNCAIEFF